MKSSFKAKKTVKHLNKDIKMEKKEIAEDKKLKKEVGGKHYGRGR